MNLVIKYAASFLLLLLAMLTNYNRLGKQDARLDVKTIFKLKNRSLMLTDLQIIQQIVNVALDSYTRRCNVSPITRKQSL